MHANARKKCGHDSCHLQCCRWDNFFIFTAQGGHVNLILFMRQRFWLEKFGYEIGFCKICNTYKDHHLQF